MKQKPIKDQEDLSNLIDDRFDEMSGEPEVIETMRALWKLNIELVSEVLSPDRPDVLH